MYSHRITINPENLNFLSQLEVYLKFQSQDLITRKRSSIIVFQKVLHLPRDKKFVKISKNNQAIAIGERTNKLFEIKFRDDRTQIDQKVSILSTMITQVSLEVLYNRRFGKIMHLYLAVPSFVKIVLLKKLIVCPFRRVNQ